ncbi:MAG TPA: class II aldolase/adducin family protein [Tenuifilaceae bacterium]|nr:class II aldolase/adducin family protein [Tenuifilaceae bacterium]HOZ15354.1 class II aldolase/adducin family protein [Tenuifilaceae bacterium]HPI45535.1 class II aldolase/adducin family protein [Tenuifilaceae bacterium]HPN23003.1 class II aldolase/adducin family protein [Tenuifilaceae bacterium]HPV57362.1 class II aldolase/adducin family protein [Tenuifilaceae bacterium]
MQDGVIKFTCNWTKAEPFTPEIIAELNYWRQILYAKGLIGLDKQGIGYGNISMRYQQNQFIISGSGTGQHPELTNEHYTLVTNFNVHRNTVDAVGPIIASSESMTHAILYQCDPSINAVVHIHHRELWRILMYKVPTTDKKAEYGTPEMAKEMVRLYSKTELPKSKLLVMAGHEEGVVSFGINVELAAKIIVDKMIELGIE